MTPRPPKITGGIDRRRYGPGYPACERYFLHARTGGKNPPMRINLCFVNARQYSIVKDQSCQHLAISFQRKPLRSASRELIADC
jgi:hypothetical protein